MTPDSISMYRAQKFINTFPKEARAIQHILNSKDAEESATAKKRARSAK